MTFMGMYLIYLALGGLIAGAFLLWAVWNNQFRDQQRARYLALGDDAEIGELGGRDAVSCPQISSDSSPTHDRLPSTVLVTLIVCGLGLVSVVAALIVMAFQGAGGGA
jgi:cbb3-type cytochrome oxidase maturation protein